MPSAPPFFIPPRDARGVSIPMHGLGRCGRAGRNTKHWRSIKWGIRMPAWQGEGLLRSPQGSPPKSSPAACWREMACVTNRAASSLGAQRVFCHGPVCSGCRHSWNPALREGEPVQGCLCPTSPCGPRNLVGRRQTPSRVLGSWPEQISIRHGSVSGLSQIQKLHRALLSQGEIPKRCSWLVTS